MEKEPAETAVEQGLPQDAEMLLPHKPPMLLVETLVAREGSRTVALATLPVAGLFVASGRIFPEYFIELIAQTAALGNCHEAYASGMKPRDGMLVGIDTFSWLAEPQIGTPVRIETDTAFVFGAMKVIHGSVYAGKDLLAEGDVKVWENLQEETPD